jgi:hypothetical protein
LGAALNEKLWRSQIVGITKFKKCDHCRNREVCDGSIELNYLKIEKGKFAASPNPSNKDLKE